MKLVTLAEISEYRKEYCNHCQRETVFELKAPWQDRGDGIKRFLYTCTTQLGVDPITHRVIICGDTQTIGVHYGQQNELEGRADAKAHIDTTLLHSADIHNSEEKR